MYSIVVLKPNLGLHKSITVILSHLHIISKMIHAKKVVWETSIFSGIQVCRNVWFRIESITKSGGTLNTISKTCIMSDHDIFYLKKLHMNKRDNWLTKYYHMLLLLKHSKFFFLVRMLLPVFATCAILTK